MREVTNDLYKVKPDLEFAINIYDKFDNKDKGNDFINKYRNQATSEIFNVSTNKWTLLGPFKENRDKIDFYNKHTKIIESMIEQQEADAKLGADLMKDRVKKKKVKNEKIFGPNDPQFDVYKKNNPSSMESLYGIKVDELDDGNIKVTQEVEMGEDGTELDADGTPLNALEIDVHRIDAKTSKMSTSRIYSKVKDSN